MAFVMSSFVADTWNTPPANSSGSWRTGLTQRQIKSGTFQLNLGIPLPAEKAVEAADMRLMPHAATIARTTTPSWTQRLLESTEGERALREER